MISKPRLVPAIILSTGELPADSVKFGGIGPFVFGCGRAWPVDSFPRPWPFYGHGPPPSQPRDPQNNALPRHPFIVEIQAERLRVGVVGYRDFSFRIFAPAFPKRSCGLPDKAAPPGPSHAMNSSSSAAAWLQNHIVFARWRDLRWLLLKAFSSATASAGRMVR